MVQEQAMTRQVITKRIIESDMNQIKKVTAEIRQLRADLDQDQKELKLFYPSDGGDGPGEKSATGGSSMLGKRPSGGLQRLRRVKRTKAAYK